MSDQWLKAVNTMQIDMLLLGKTGTGKSSTGNSIIGRKVFKTAGNSTSQTGDIQSAWCCYTDDNFRHYDLKVTDGPGLEDTNLNSLQDKRRAYLNMTKVLSQHSHGIHAFLVVVKMGYRFTKEDKHALESLKEILGNDFLRNFGVIIVTGGDDLHGDEDNDESKTFEDWCREQVGELKKVMIECNNRCVLFDNRTKDEALKKKQLDTLLELVLEIKVKNNRERYTNETFMKCGESHKKLLDECGLTNMKEEFRKQLNLLEGEVRRIADNKNDETYEAHEQLKTLLRQVEYEITLTPELENLQKDLLDLKQCLIDIELVNETGGTRVSALDEAIYLCKKMVKTTSPPDAEERANSFCSVL